MRILGIIPARYHSTRLPAKMLADIGGKPLIQWVYERSCQALGAVVIATDHAAIYAAAQSFGATVYMTSADHPSGTDRCAEVVQLLEQAGKTYDWVINIQGDEPFIQPEQINSLQKLLIDTPTVQIGTLARQITAQAPIFNPNVVKVVMNHRGKALYFSRSPMPYLRGVAVEDWLDKGIFYQHIGLYGFRTSVLKQLTALLPSRLEQSEALEQLRWLENGYEIQVAVTPYATMGIDTPEDLESARERVRRNK